MAVVLGSLVALVGAALALGGAALILAHAFARDSDGFYTTGTERLATNTYALTVKDIDLGAEPANAIPKDVLSRVRIRAERPGGGAIFIGIGPDRQVDAYLRGVAHAQVDDLDPPRYVTRRGGPPREPPTAQRFWVASIRGSGRQTLTWEVKGGRWAIVAMNPDASRPVVVEADAGAKVGWFLGVGIGLLVVGLLLVAGSVALIVIVARRSSS